jgi:hypothetical protein
VGALQDVVHKRKPGEITKIEVRVKPVGEHHTPLKPSQLVDALNDTVHEEKVGKISVIKTCKKKPEPENEEVISNGDYYTTFTPDQLLGASQDVIHEPKIVETKIVKAFKKPKDEPANS